MIFSTIIHFQHLKQAELSLQQDSTLITWIKIIIITF